MATYDLVQGPKSTSLPVYLKYTLGEPQQITIEPEGGKPYKATIPGPGTVDILCDLANAVAVGDIVWHLGPIVGQFEVTSVTEPREARGNYNAYSENVGWQQLTVKHVSL